MAPSTGLPEQFAALPVVVIDGEPLVLLLTSRETKRWVIPKGWPIKGLKPPRSAAQEALEEAGVIGKPKKKPLGSYVYWKRMQKDFVLCTVVVFLLPVSEQLLNWRERGQRRLFWCPPETAAGLVEEAGLSTLLTSVRRRLKLPEPDGHPHAGG